MMNAANTFSGDTTMVTLYSHKLFDSFYNSRHGETHAETVCKMDKYPGKKKHEPDNKYGRNAAAALLYKKNDEGVYVPYVIPGTDKNKQYHCISSGYDFADHTKGDSSNKTCSYGHSERILIRDILDDLIASSTVQLTSSVDNQVLSPPSDDRQPKSPEVECEILKELSENKALQSKYKTYLEENNFIIKLMSERPPCQKGHENRGGPCTEFIRNIYPVGSQFEFLVLTPNPDQNTLESALEEFFIRHVRPRSEGVLCSTD